MNEPVTITIPAIDEESADLAVIIVNYNGWADTVDAYRSLERSTYTRWTAIVVDNASSDASLPTLREEIKRGSLIESPTNLGFAAGCNLAFEKAIADGRDYVFLLNNDACVTPDCLDRLVAASKGLNDTAILGCAVKFTGTDDYQFFGSRTGPVNGIPSWFTYEKDGHLLQHDFIESDFAFGAAMLIPVAILSTIGLFTKEFFLNYEETDFCYRARKRGVKSFVLTNALAYHRSGASMGDYNSPLQSYFLTRNELLFLEKHGAWHQRRRAFVYRVKTVLKAFKKSFLHRKALSPSDRSMLLGFRDYVFRRFGDCPQAVRKLAATARRGE